MAKSNSAQIGIPMIPIPNIARHRKNDCFESDLIQDRVSVLVDRFVAIVKRKYDRFLIFAAGWHNIWESERPIAVIGQKLYLLLKSIRGDGVDAELILRINFVVDKDGDVFEKVDDQLNVPLRMEVQEDVTSWNLDAISCSFEAKKSP